MSVSLTAFRVRRFVAALISEVVKEGRYHKVGSTIAS